MHLNCKIYIPHIFLLFGDHMSSKNMTGKGGMYRETKVHINFGCKGQEKDCCGELRKKLGVKLECNSEEIIWEYINLTELVESETQSLDFGSQWLMFGFLQWSGQ